MRGIANFVLAIVLLSAGCGKVAPITGDGGTDATGGSCTANTQSCGAGDALYQCDDTGANLSKIQDCQFGCTVDHCNECDPNTTFCSGDDLVTCNATGTITNPMACASGCQMDRCNTCKPGVAYCSSATAVTCNADGTPGAMQNCGAAGCTSGVCNSCVANTTTCQGDTLVVCNGAGMVQSATACALGCGTTPSSHCKALVPSYGVPAPAGSLPDLLVDANATLDLTNCGAAPASVQLTIGTTTTSLVSPQVARVSQPLGSPICVVRFGKITVASGFTLSITGMVSLQATGDIQIDGTIGSQSYPDALAPTIGASAMTTTASPPLLAPGAGGGGAARAGGNGGGCNGVATGGVGGTAVTTINTTLTPGNAGGSVLQPFGSGTLQRGAGGLGGGAIHLVSLTRVTVPATGRVVLNGQGVVGSTNSVSLGAGGGAGGTLVVEAPTLSLSANSIVVANGGAAAGGCQVCMGGPIPVCTNANGESGQLSAMRAAGGNCMGAGNGGFEASGPTNPSANGANGTGTISGGGGGGSSGFIILRARAAANVSVAGTAVVSPPATIGAVTAN